jgi:DnaK suppressor protein
MKGDKLNKREKDHFRKMLTEKKKTIVDKMSGFYNESLEIETGTAQDLGDKAESSYTKEFLLSLSNAERQRLIKIDAALKRLDTPEFGLCDDCGKSIGKKRLDVIPWTPHCIVCQEKEEQGS